MLFEDQRPCILFCVQINVFLGQSVYQWIQRLETQSGLVASHENCSQHRDSMAALCSRKEIIGRVDYNLVQQYFFNESPYCRKVLHRIVSVVQLLCQRGLAFRGKDEVIGSTSNGNYLGILELISNHDTFLTYSKAC